MMPLSASSYEPFGAAPFPADQPDAPALAPSGFLVGAVGGCHYSSAADDDSSPVSPSLPTEPSGKILFGLPVVDGPDGEERHRFSPTTVGLK